MNRPPELAPSWRLVATDTVLLAAACAVATAPLGGVYAGRRWIVTALIGFVLGAGITLLARALRWGVLLTGLVVAAGYLLVGPAAATPHQAVGGVLPSLDGLRTLATGIVTAWRSTLTMPVPMDGRSGELVVPFAVALAGATVATAFLWRTRLPGLAAGAVIVVFAVSAAFGTRTAGFPLLRGLLLAVLLVLWLRWRALRLVRTSWPRRVALGLAMVSVAGVAGWGLTAAVAGQQTREVLRDHVEPPLRELELKSPLSRYRDFYKDHLHDVLFTVDNLPKGGDHLVRLATMDSFDGYVWNVSTTDLVNGTSAFRTAPDAAGDDPVKLTIGALDGPWLPTIGHATGATLVRDASGGAERELLLNTASGTLAQSGGVREGDVYEIDWTPRRDGGGVATSADRSVPLAHMDLPAAPAKLDEATQAWITGAGATSDFAVAQALERGFHDNGYFSDGQDPKAEGYSPAGHGLKRLVDMFADPDRIVGNDEQYASAMAYAAQRMGLPARVVLGFRSPGSSAEVTGDDIAAWVEIPFKGRGWVAFDPVPEEDRTPPPEKDSRNPRPQPYVVQPPVVPEEPADVQGIPPEGSGKDLGDKFWDVLLKVLGGLLVALRVLLVLAPLWLILLFKWLRRRRRRGAADPLLRVSGAWRELSDHARDLGARVPAGHTRHETGSVLAARFPSSEPAGLAAVADRHVFGPGGPTAEEVDAFWADVETALKRMRADVPRWRRVAGWFSLASVPWRRGASRAGEALEGMRTKSREWGRRTWGRLTRRNAEQEEQA